MKKQLLNLPSSSSAKFSFYHDGQIFFRYSDSLVYPITGDSKFITKLKAENTLNKISLKEYTYSVTSTPVLGDNFKTNSISAMEGIGDD